MSLENIPKSHLKTIIEDLKEQEEAVLSAIINAENTHDLAKGQGRLYTLRVLVSKYSSLLQKT
jgi:hypothetical protein